MIVVKLIGGLGNQLFQYAVGRSLSIRNKTSLHLDVTELNNTNQLHTYRKYELTNFNITAIVTSGGFITYKNGIVGFFATLLNFFRKKKILKEVVEKKIHYDPSLKLVSDNIYLNGYWNSPNYFNEYADIIKKDFSFNFKLEEKNKVIAEKIKSTCSVSLHIRRGDYITNSEANAYHGTCDIDYYNKAVSIILEKNKNAQFFIFTDDPVWANQNFKIEAEFFIVSSINNSDALQDMYLMTLCKHAIIANSTYSWWAAWLINNKEKIVVAPLKWYNQNTIDTKDLFPSSWIRI